MTDTRFPTALQIVLTLANAERLGRPLVTSSQLAYGVGSTASLVRRLVIPLARDGIVRASHGKNGGVQIGRAASEITLGQIYRSVVGDKSLLGARLGVPHRCEVSSRVERYFARIASEADAAVVDALDRRTLAESLDELLALKRPGVASPGAARTRRRMSG